MKGEITTARFWIYWNGSMVRLALKDGQSLEFRKFSHTEEGWESVDAAYTREGDVITRDMVRDGRDCDGRLTVYDTDETSVALLASGLSFDGDPAQPRWSRVRESQYDETAQNMGY